MCSQTGIISGTFDRGKREVEIDFVLGIDIKHKKPKSFLDKIIGSHVQVSFKLALLAIIFFLALIYVAAAKYSSGQIVVFFIIFFCCISDFVQCIIIFHIMIVYKSVYV